MLETDKLEVSPNDVLSADTAFETPADNALARSTKPPGPGLFEALAWCLGMQVAHLIGGVLTQFPGTLPVYLEISQNGHKACLEVGDELRVTPGPDLRRALTVWL